MITTVPTTSFESIGGYPFVASSGVLTAVVQPVVPADSIWQRNADGSISPSNLVSTTDPSWLLSIGTLFPR